MQSTSEIARDWLELVSRNVAYPLSVQIETTTRCNLRCIMCPKGANDEVMGGLDTGTFDRIGGLLDHAWEIRPHGFGEAFLHRDLARILERAARSHARIAIVTNGTLIDDERARLLVETKVHRLYVSIDAVDPHLFQEIRKTKLEKILDNVRRLQAVKAARGSRLPHLTLQMVGMSNNVHEIPAMVELASSLGADEVHLVAFTEFDMAAVHAASLRSLLSVPETARRHLAEGRRLARELGVRLEVAPIYRELLPPDDEPPEREPSVRVAPSHPSLSSLARRVARRFREHPMMTLKIGARRALAGAASLAHPAIAPKDNSPRHGSPLDPVTHAAPRLAARPKVRCEDPWNVTFVNWKGEVNPCCMSQRVMGNVNQTSFETIWNEDEWITFRQRGTVSVNGQMVGTFELSSWAGKEFIFALPERRDPELSVRIVCDLENIPRVLGVPDDVRRLGIGLKNAALVDEEIPRLTRAKRAAVGLPDAAR